MGFFDKFSRKKPGEVAKEPKVLPKAVEKKAGASAKEAKKDAKPAKKEAKKAEGAKEFGGDSHLIIVKPVFTEKTAALEAASKYTFIVSRGATKVSVSQAIRDLYGVKPASVHIVVIKGKRVRFGRWQGREKDLKKAVVTLPKGQTISLVEGA